MKVNENVTSSHYIYHAVPPKRRRSRRWRHTFGSRRGLSRQRNLSIIWRFWLLRRCPGGRRHCRLCLCLRFTLADSRNNYFRYFILISHIPSQIVYGKIMLLNKISLASMRRRICRVVHALMCSAVPWRQQHDE